MTVKFYLLFVAILVSCSSAQAANWFVDVNNCGGDGSGRDNALCTIQEGINAAFADQGGEVRIAGGEYVEFLDLLADVQLQGAEDETVTVVYPGSEEEEVILVRMANDTNIQGITFRVPEDTNQIVVLIRIDNVKVELEEIILDGGMNLGSVGILVSGPDSSKSRIRKSTFQNLSVGMIAQNTEMRVTRNLFTDILRDAIFVRLPVGVIDNTGILIPEIGDDDEIEISGFNRFRNIGGFGPNENDSFLIRNSTGILLRAQFNDWGVFDTVSIANRLSTALPLTDTTQLKERREKGDNAALVEPFIGKSIFPDSIFVQVLDRSTGLGIPLGLNPTVGIEPGGLEIMPDFDEESGLLILTPLAAQAYTLTTTADGFDPLIKNVVLNAGDLLTVVMSMYAEGTTPPPSTFQCDAGSQNGSNRRNAADFLLMALAVVMLLGLGRAQKRIS